MDWRGKVVIVTGSGTGVGAACARLLATHGARVVVNYSRSEQAAADTAKACRAAGGEAIVVQADVAQDADCLRLAQAAQDAWGRIDGLVNNAGTTRFVGLRNLDGLAAEDFQRIYAVNVVGAFQMARACAAALRATRGAIVNVSSRSTHDGTGSSLAYACSKGALNTLTLGLAKALGPEVRVNAVLPGLIDSRWLREGWGEEVYERVATTYKAQSALQDTLTPEDVAESIVALLALPKTTGERLTVDAGRLLGVAPG
ncbi:MAG: SDR family oxidoreductase [Ideonella sp.]|nr:SDR family oxidoreductase [Ideonella sp.]